MTEQLKPCPEAVEALACAARFTADTAKRYIRELNRIGWDVTPAAAPLPYKVAGDFDRLKQHATAPLMPSILRIEAHIVALEKQLKVPGLGTHLLYETSDADAPDCIKDRNGEVVLGLCRVCGKGESELSGPCTPKAQSANDCR